MGKALKEVLSTVLYLVVIVLLTFLFVKFVMQRTEVKGSSMEPALQDGDSLLVDKISYRLKAPERFDIIVFPFEYKEHTYFIKRIIGLPGETVQITGDGTILINGKKLEEYYGREKITDPGRAATPFTLGPDEYFVMGDNRNYSMDGRDPAVGNIKKKDIIGKAWISIYPFSKFGLLEHGKDPLAK